MMIINKYLMHPWHHIFIFISMAYVAPCIESISFDIVFFVFFLSRATLRIQKGSLLYILLMHTFSGHLG